MDDGYLFSVYFTADLRNVNIRDGNRTLPQEEGSAQLRRYECRTTFIVDSLVDVEQKNKPLPEPIEAIRSQPLVLREALQRPPISSAHLAHRLPAFTFSCLLASE